MSLGVVLLKALGAQLVLTPAEKGMGGAVAKAEAIVAETDGGFVLHQFNNADNPKIHEGTTGPEIWYQTDGKIDIMVRGVAPVALTGSAIPQRMQPQSSDNSSGATGLCSFRWQTGPTRSRAWSWLYSKL